MFSLGARRIARAIRGVGVVGLRRQKTPGVPADDSSQIHIYIHMYTHMCVCLYIYTGECMGVCTYIYIYTRKVQLLRSSEFHDTSSHSRQLACCALAKTTASGNAAEGLNDMDRALESMAPLYAVE